MTTAKLTATLEAYRKRDAAVAMGEVRDPQDVPRLLAAIEAVLALHVQAMTHNDDGETIFRYCARCSGHPAWPCPEVQAISKALEVGELYRAHPHEAAGAC
jgi:hypothetical protein